MSRTLQVCKYCHKPIQFYHGMWLDPLGAICKYLSPGLKHEPAKEEDQPIEHYCSYCGETVESQHGDDETWHSLITGSRKCPAPGVVYHNGRLRQKKEDQPMSTSPTWDEVDRTLSSLFTRVKGSVSNIALIKQALRELWDTPENAPVGQVRVDDGTGVYYVKIVRPEKSPGTKDEFEEHCWQTIDLTEAAYFTHSFMSHDSVRNFRVAGVMPK